MKKALTICTITYAVTAPTTAHAVTFSKIVGDTFTSGGAGGGLIQLLLIALVGWLSMYIAQAAQQGQIAGMIKIASVFSCIGIIAKLAWGALKTVCAFAGVTF